MKKIFSILLASSITVMAIAQPPMGGGQRPGGGGGGRPMGGGGASTPVMGAGTNASEAKAVVDAKKALDKAIDASNKKGDKAGTWTALSDAYVKAYDAPSQNILQGSSMNDVNMFLRGQKATDITTRTGAEGVEYDVVSYDNKDLYYRNGFLEFWIVTKPVADNALDKAYEALEKAYGLDAKAATNKSYREKAETIHDDFYTEAVSVYLSGNPAGASQLFSKAANISDGKILNEFDSLSNYNAALMAAMAGDRAAAIARYKLCMDKGFYNDGTVYSNLAELYKAEGDTVTSQKVLEEGFEAYPNSQAILVGLINHYLETNSEPSKLFTLLHNAQANDPRNASLFYVEGDAYKRLGEYDKAIELYDKSLEIDPSYIYGILNKGILYYDQAVETQRKASLEMDDAKYSVLMGELSEYLEKAIEPFEKAFEMTNDKDIKLAVADYLKNIYYRFRDKGPNYMEAYEKYNNYLKGE